MEIRESLEAIIDAAIDAARADGSLQLEEAPEAALERPRDEANGDWASTVALRVSKLAHKSPREIAQIIVDHIPENDMIASVEIAGPGFINIRLSDAVLQGVVREVREEGDNFGRGTIPEGERYVNLEYVSANPTGPFHVGHGRWASLGDAMARVMRHGGYDVYEEYYINDHGNQMDVFGNSVNVRYQQLLGRDVEMPEACYGGAYVKDIAQDIIDRDGDKWLSVSDEERVEAFREMAYDMTLKNQREVLANFGTTFDKWFSERSLYVEDENGESAVSRSLDAMREKGYLYEKDGALWLKTSDILAAQLRQEGKSDEAIEKLGLKDDVLRRANGFYTYFAADIAYHRNKFAVRGFDKVINIWGADHHGHVARLKGAMDALGLDGQHRLDIVLMQLVKLVRDGETVRMSKRTGKAISLTDLLDEIPVDAARWFFVSKDVATHMDLDLKLARSKDNNNPVYYAQYAYSRMCSILKNPQIPEFKPVDSYDRLTDEKELQLLKMISEFPKEVAADALNRKPNKMTEYIISLVKVFHSYYNSTKVNNPDDPELTNQRLGLIKATMITLKNALQLIGVSAPETM